jgi:hypothetical protein
MTSIVRARAETAGRLTRRTQNDRRAWTCKEVAVLKANYPKGGIASCESLLPNRSRAAIYSMAGELRLKKIGRQPSAGPLSPIEVAVGLGVTETRVAAWMREGLEYVVRDGEPRITWAALRRWIAAHPLRVDLSRVDRVWFIGLAFSRRMGAAS